MHGLPGQVGALASGHSGFPNCHAPGVLRPRCVVHQGLDIERNFPPRMPSLATNAAARARVTCDTADASTGDAARGVSGLGDFSSGQ
jgi:hypothetical protein